MKSFTFLKVTKSRQETRKQTTTKKRPRRETKGTQGTQHLTVEAKDLISKCSGTLGCNSKDGLVLFIDSHIVFASFEMFRSVKHVKHSIFVFYDRHQFLWCLMLGWSCLVHDALGVTRRTLTVTGNPNTHRKTMSILDPKMMDLAILRRGKDCKFNWCGLCACLRLRWATHPMTLKAPKTQ